MFTTKEAGLDGFEKGPRSTGVPEKDNNITLRNADLWIFTFPDRSFGFATWRDLGDWWKKQGGPSIQGYEDDDASDENPENKLMTRFTTALRNHPHWFGPRYNDASCNGKLISHYAIFECR